MCINFLINHIDLKIDMTIFYNSILRHQHNINNVNNVKYTKNKKVSLLIFIVQDFIRISYYI